jgi:hypothetical protein
METKHEQNVESLLTEIDTLKQRLAEEMSLKAAAQAEKEQLIQFIRAKFRKNKNETDGCLFAVTAIIVMLILIYFGLSFSNSVNQ